MKKLFSLMVALVCSVLVSHADTYIVTGANQSIFGSSWDAKSSCVLSQQSDGSYAWTKTDVTLASGTYEYKYLTLEGGWDGWKLPNNGNATFTISKSGVYTLTFTLSSDLSTQNVDAVLSSEVEVLPEIKLHGNFYDPGWSSSEAFVYSADKTTASLTLSALAADTEYEFGFYFDGGWKANGAVLTATNNSTNLGSGSGNMKITTSSAGDYLFTYTVATQDLVVTYPGGGEGGGEEGGNAVYGIACDANNWDYTANAMTVANGVATCTLTLAEGEFEFSVVENINGNLTWLKNVDDPIMRDLNSVVLGEVKGYDNCILVADVAGDYVFSYTIDTKTLVITFPNEGEGGGEGGGSESGNAAYGLAFNANNWTYTENLLTVADGVATGSLTLESGDFEFSVVEDKDGNLTWLKNVETPITRENNSVVLGVVASYDNCTLVADVEGEYVFSYTISTKSIEVTFPAQTGLRESVVSGAPVKIIRNGQVLIVRDGVVYDMMGQTVK